MLKQLRDFRRRWLDYKQEDKVYRTLDTILISLGENKNLEDQLFWLVRLLRWVRHTSGSGESPLTRIKFFLMILDRHPQHKETVARTLRNILRNTSALELFTETGLPKELGLWGELSDRLILKALPVPPLEHNLSALFWALFPDENDAHWLASIDAETFSQLVCLFNYKADQQESPWNHIDDDIQNALKFLVIQVRALGLTPAIRHRLDDPSFTSSAFYHLGETFDALLLAT